MHSTALLLSRLWLGHGRSEVEAGGAALEALRGDGVDVALAHDDVELAVHLDLGLVVGLEEDPVVLLDRAPMAAVAGMTMPPEERRSPASLSTSTSTRSCSILIGAVLLLSMDVVFVEVVSGRPCARPRGAR